MTEFCSPDAERRGIACNRWLQCLQAYLRYQNEDQIKRANKAIMDTTKYTELYEEIDKILPAITYCLAPKKVSDKKGAASLRCGVSTSEENEEKDPSMLDSHAKTLYDWLEKRSQSRIRMLLHWQSAGGLSFVAGCHHRAATCFKYHGNMQHEDQSGDAVSLEDFQAAIKARHKKGSSGIDTSPSEDQKNDYD